MAIPLLVSNGLQNQFSYICTTNNTNTTIMKIQHLLLLALMIGLIASCKSKMTKKNTEPVITMEDHVIKTYEFPSGVYYWFEFEDETPYDFDETTIIKSLHQAEIFPTDVWYKGGSSMCVPPGSDIGMTVIVPPALLVRLEKAADAMQGLGFSIPEEPHVGDCAYRVKHYSF